MKPAIFLDRDGVLIESRQDYVRTREDIVFYPAALKALAKASRGSHMIVIVTNQSGVGRGLIDMDEADAINRHLVIEVQKAGGESTRSVCAFTLRSRSATAASQSRDCCCMPQACLDSTYQIQS